MYINHPNRKLNRMCGFDYSKDAFYFVTICVKNRMNYFGKIKNQKMILNKYGQIVKYCWRDLINYYWNCILDEFIIMPNHVHGIIEIDNQILEGTEVRAGFKPARTNPVRAKLYPLTEIIRGFKSFSSRRINEINSQDLFRWQRSFHDHIIRNNDSLDRIRDYIKTNPKNWENDGNNIKK